MSLLRLCEETKEENLSPGNGCDPPKDSVNLVENLPNHVCSRVSRGSALVKHLQSPWQQPAEGALQSAQRSVVEATVPQRFAATGLRHGRASLQILRVGNTSGSGQ